MKHDFRLSKTRIAAFEQCPRRLWLLTHNQDAAKSGDDAEQRFAAGNAVGEEACRQCIGGTMIEADPDLSAAVSTTRTLLAKGHRHPIYEATFEHDGVLVRVDILEPRESGWHLAEVKSSTRAKPEQKRDLATQVWVARKAGLPVVSAAVRHLNPEFVRGESGSLAGLFSDANLSEEIEPLIAEREAIIADARAMLAREEPSVVMGKYCIKPYPCEFNDHCSQAVEAGPEWPVTILPNRGGNKFLRAGVADLLMIDADELSSDTHRRVHRATMTGVPEHDAIGAATVIGGWSYPRVWLDFETVSDAIPVWSGCWPYRQVPFQFVAEVESCDGAIERREFLSLDGADPRRACAEALCALPPSGAVIAWFARFEQERIEELARDFLDLSTKLLSLASRVVDLLLVTRNHWYHRDQRGSWSIKAVLPTIAPELEYASLAVQHGGAAVNAYREATAANCTPDRRVGLDRALRTYCGRDVEAMRVIARALVQGKNAVS